MATTTVGWSDEKELCVQKLTVKYISQGSADNKPVVAKHCRSHQTIKAQNLTDWRLVMLSEFDTCSDRRLRHNGRPYL